MPAKSNDVLEEQIKQIFKILESNKEDYMGIFWRIEKMLLEIKNDSVTNEQLDYALKLHEAHSVARHEKIETDMVMLKRIVWWAVFGVLAALWKSFVGLFDLIIK